MTIDDFENNVFSKILTRGDTYYRSGQVTSLKLGDDGVCTAIVRGTEDYKVKVTMDGKNISSWSCSCPYDGSMCKHVVAVLFAIREAIKAAGGKIAFTPKKPAKKTAAKPKVDAVNVADILQNVTKEEIVKFLSDYSKSNPYLKKGIVNAFAPKAVKAKAHFDFAREVRKCFTDAVTHSYRYNDEMLDWDDALCGIEELLEKASEMVKAGDYDDAASIALEIFTCVNDYNSDYYWDDCYGLDDALISAASVAISIFKAKNAPHEVKDRILYGLEKIEQLPAYSEHNVYNIKSLICVVKPYCLPLNEAVDFLDSVIDNTLEQKGKYFIGIDEAVADKLDYLNEMGEKAMFDATVDKYVSIPKVRKLWLSELLNRENYAEALTLLDEGFELAAKKGNNYYKKFWLQQKINVYSMLKDEENLIDVASKLFVLDAAALNYYNLLKNHVEPKKWKSFLAPLIDQVKQKSDNSPYYSADDNLAKIFVSEHDEENLVELLAKNNSLLMYNSYIGNLSHEYLKKALEAFANLLRKYAEDNLGRDSYQQLHYYLILIQKLDGGKEVVDGLLDEFKAKYGRRPAMMAELFGKKK
jgi:hypothetical protein